MFGAQVEPVALLPWEVSTMIYENSSLFLSVVIPAYNEAERIGATILALGDYFARQTYAWELVVVDDGSNDNTIEVVENAYDSKYGNLRIIRGELNRGKGHAVKSGMLAAKGEFVLFMDADMSTPISELDRFLPLLLNGHNVVIGSRKTKGAAVLVKQPWYRQKMGAAFTKLVRRSLGLRVTDVTCGFKCFHQKAAREIFSRQRLVDWSFDAEILFIAKKLGYQIREVPVEWSDVEGTRVRLRRDVIKTLLGLREIRLNNAEGHYNPDCQQNSD